MPDTTRNIADERVNRPVADPETRNEPDDPDLTPDQTGLEHDPDLPPPDDKPGPENEPEPAIGRATVVQDETAAAEPIPLISDDERIGASTTTYPDDKPAPLLAPELREDLHNRWQALQLRFVDDPHAVAAEAADLVDEAVAALRTALDDRKRALDAWNDGDGADTEQLRVTVQRYRDFIEEVVGH